MDILTIQHLTKVYGSGPTATRALDDVSFSIAAGEFVAIVGSSGSGKSTLLHLMGGVDRPHVGHRVPQQQRTSTRATTRNWPCCAGARWGIVYQFYNLIPVLDVVENMTLPVRMDGRPVNQERLAALLLDGLGLRGREAPPAQPALRRPAAARGHRPRPHERARRPAGRRAHRQPRHAALSREIMGHPARLELAASARRSSSSRTTRTSPCAADRVIAIEDGRIARDERIRK